MIVRHGGRQQALTSGLQLGAAHSGTLVYALTGSMKIGLFGNEDRVGTGLAEHICGFKDSAVGHVLLRSGCIRPHCRPSNVAVISADTVYYIPPGRPFFIMDDSTQNDVALISQLLTGDMLLRGTLQAWSKHFSTLACLWRSWEAGWADQVLRQQLLDSCDDSCDDVPAEQRWEQRDCQFVRRALSRQLDAIHSQRQWWWLVEVRAQGSSVLQDAAAFLPPTLVLQVLRNIQTDLAQQQHGDETDAPLAHFTSHELALLPDLIFQVEQQLHSALHFFQHFHPTLVPHDVAEPSAPSPAPPADLSEIIQTTLEKEKADYRMLDGLVRLAMLHEPAVSSRVPQCSEWSSNSQLFARLLAKHEFPLAPFTLCYTKGRTADELKELLAEQQPPDHSAGSEDAQLAQQQPLNPRLVQCISFLMAPQQLHPDTIKATDPRALLLSLYRLVQRLKGGATLLHVQEGFHHWIAMRLDVQSWLEAEQQQFKLDLAATSAGQLSDCDVLFSLVFERATSKFERDVDRHFEELTTSRVQRWLQYFKQRPHDRDVLAHCVASLTRRRHAFHTICDKLLRQKVSPNGHSPAGVCLWCVHLSCPCEFSSVILFEQLPKASMIPKVRKAWSELELLGARRQGYSVCDLLREALDLCWPDVTSTSVVKACKTIVDMWKHEILWHVHATLLDPELPMWLKQRDQCALFCAIWASSPVPPAVQPDYDLLFECAESTTHSSTPCALFMTKGQRSKVPEWIDSIQDALGRPRSAVFHTHILFSVVQHVTQNPKEFPPYLKVADVQLMDIVLHVARQYGYKEVRNKQRLSVDLRQRSGTSSGFFLLLFLSLIGKVAIRSPGRSQALSSDCNCLARGSADCSNGQNKQNH